MEERTSPVTRTNYDCSVDKCGGMLLGDYLRKTPCASKFITVDNGCAFAQETSQRLGDSFPPRGEASNGYRELRMNNMVTTGRGARVERGLGGYVSIKAVARTGALPFARTSLSLHSVSSFLFLPSSLERSPSCGLR